MAHSWLLAFFVLSCVFLHKPLYIIYQLIVVSILMDTNGFDFLMVIKHPSTLQWQILESMKNISPQPDHKMISTVANCPWWRWEILYNSWLYINTCGIIYTFIHQALRKLITIYEKVGKNKLHYNLKLQD